MQSKRLNKYLGVMLGILTLLVLGMTGFVFAPRNTQSASAATQYMTVQKVFLPDASAGTVSDPSEFWHVEETAESIAEGDFVILNTTQRNYTDSSNTTYSGREAIAINFGGTATSKGIPTVSVRFNNNLLKINKIKEITDETGVSTGVATFSQYLFALTPDEIVAAGLDDCYYTKYSNGENVAFPEGLYTVTLVYFDTIQGKLTEEINFYITTQKTYNQVNENPTLNNTEKVDAVDDTNPTANIYNQMTATVNYFNFNNLDTTYYDAAQGNFIRGRYNPSELYYPTLIYNPEKFDISYTRTLYNYRETVTTTFSVYKVTENGITKNVGYLDVSTYTTENPTDIIRRTYVIEANADGNYSINMQFDKVGEYEITKTPKLKIGYTGARVNYVTPANNIITANQEYVSPLSLVVNGYVANYSNSTTTTAPLYDDTFSYNTMANGESINRTNDTVYTRDFLTSSARSEISATARTRAETIYTADMTFANTNFVSNSGASTVSMSVLKNNIINYDPTATDSDAFTRFFAYNQATNYIRLSQQVTQSDGSVYYTKRASTNLAPVSFEFYGKLYTGSSTQYASWYAFRDTSGNVSVNRYTRGMSFANAGEYVVYLTYENTIYSNNNQNGSRKNQYMHQIFCFEITNNTPTINVYAQDNSSTPTILSSEYAESISIDSYTNNYVYASWETAGPFDAGIYCTYNVYDWNGNILSEGNALDGLVYQTNKESGAKYAVSEKAAKLLYGSRKTINRQFGQDGYYQIQVFRTNNSKAWVNYTFSIDTAPISGIKTLRVIDHNLWRENGSTEPMVLSELDYNNPDAFNLISSTAFGFTWADKSSGAPITAQYIYASINKTTNFDLVKAITGSDTATETDAVSKLIAMAGSGKVYMPTNASLGVFTPAMNYNKIKTDTPEDIVAPLADSQIINTPQLAFLLLRDAAGNTAIYATMLDNTNTQVLQVERQASYVNVITKDTNFYWGTHKSLTAEQSTAAREDSSVIRDIYDFVDNYDDQNETFTWTINGKSYSTHSYITKVFTDLNIKATNSINIPLREVTISAADGNDTTTTPTVGKTGFAATNWFSTIKVIPGATETDPYKTGVTIDGGQLTAENTHTLENGEFRYQITVWDNANNDNAGGLNIEVNLDKSLGSLRSYWDFDGTDLSYNRNPDKGTITDRQYVANTYSTDRRYVAFSWTEPGDAFKIESIVLQFYAFSSKIDSQNYPYSDTPSKTVVLYNIDKGSNATYEDGTLFHITYSNGGITSKYYQTNILRKLIYSAEFENAGASEAGKYVITRTYQLSEQQTDLQGDQKTKVYTYYVDRNTVLPTNTYEYGDEKLQFGYSKGDYDKYPDYPESGTITFDNYGLLTNTEKFEKLSFDTTNITTTTPNNVITKSNILPAGVSMSTWQADGYTVYDKYYSDPKNASDYDASNPEEAYERIYETLNKYKNSSRLQVAVQFFSNSSAAQYALTSQTFYSTKTSSSSISGDYTYSRPLSELQYAFREIGRYRVVMFDLANFDGLLTGNAYTDFKKISYSLATDSNSSKNTLYPNCSVVNFELTGTAPTFNYQVGLGNDSYGPLSSQTSTEQVTNFTKSRITWSDPSDTYSARNAYNEVSVTKTIIPKGNDTSTSTPAPNEYKKYFGNVTKTTRGVFDGPIEITASDTVKAELVASGLVCVELNDEQVQSIVNRGYSSLSGYIESQTKSETEPETYLPYFLKVQTEQIVNTIINNGVVGTSLNQIEYYKVRKSDTEKLYTYYLLLPRAELEDADKNATKMVDTRYSVSIHYIAKDENDYLAFGDNKFYSATKELYQDYTAPYYNLVDLIQNDAYINSLGETFKSDLIANIDNPDYTFLKSYAFAVNTGYTINYRNKYESSTYYYYYKHENYTGEKQGQVITAEDSRYPSAPRFVKNDPKFVRAAYAGISGYSTHEFNEPGYYDIIEQDNAGNLRVYTIFVTDDSYNLRATNDDMTITADNTNILGKVYDSAKFTSVNNKGFTLTDFTSTDLWLHFKLVNMMNSEETMECYIVPQDALNDISELFDSSNVFVCSNIDDLLAKLNEFISDVAFANDESNNGFGSQIRVTIDNRADTVSKFFSINTQGKMLINSEQDFLNLITIDSTAHQFSLKMPNTTAILSTKLDSFSAFLVESDQSTIQITSDDNYMPLPTTREDFESEWAINTGYSFSLANNIVYKFVFIDNFGRRATYSYPVDSSLIKELHFSGGTQQYEWTDGNTYTFTSNDVDFVYQATGLNVALTITSLDSNKVLYQKGFDEVLDTENRYFSYIREALTSNIITLRFNATRALNNLVSIEVNNGTDVITKFEFVMYTVFPQIIISDINGSPIQNYLTSKEVMLTWVDVDALFNPYVEIVYPDGSTETITSGFTVKPEGVYTVRCVNDLGVYTSGQIVFTIQEYLISIYGVYQITSTGQTVQLMAFTESYKYTTIDGKELAISQYMYLSNDSNWERNISVICNEDKDLEYEIVETFGNTRIYRVHGKDKGLYQIEMYFAVTRIPSLNVSTYTNFRINGDSTTRAAEFKTDSTTVTWTTTYTDTTAAGRTVSYPNFFSLELYYNGTYVGKYTTGSLRLTNSGIYTISIVDPVGQKHYFGSNANSTTFSLTILTNVIYYVNDNAAIPYATYSDPVDFYIPQLEYYDYTPVVQIYRNNALYEMTPDNNGHYIFSTPGSYKIVVKAAIESVIGTVPEAQLEAVHQFIIVSPNEAIKSYDFAPVAGYEIIDVVRLDNESNITDEIRGDNIKITTLHLDPEGYGVGKYQITVRTEANGYNPSQTYTFSVWINDETVILTPSREWGSSSTQGFTITVNTASIYERIGECQIIVNGTVMLAIDDSNKDKVDPTTLNNFTQQGDYIVQLVSASGTVLQSYRMTIQEPLNTAAIILIAVAIGVVVVLTIVFVIMRRKVKVR